MEELETENLQQLLKGTKLNAYQMALANREYQRLIIFAYDMEQKVKKNVGLDVVIKSVCFYPWHDSEVSTLGGCTKCKKYEEK